MNTPANFSIQEWHGNQIFCWYGEEAIRYKGKVETFVEIEKGRVTISELFFDKGKATVCSVFSSPYKEEEIESSHMSEAFVVKKGKMVGSADSLEGVLGHLIEIMSQELKKTISEVYLMPPSGTFFYRIANFPPMPPVDMRAAISNSIAAFKEEKLKEEPALIKPWELGLVEQKDSKLSNVLLVGVPNTSILNYIEMLSDVKLGLKGFNTPQLLYFYHLNTAEQNKSFIFVEITDYSLRIYFFKAGILTFIRYIGLAKWKEESRFIHNVSSQVHHSILYLNQQYPDASLDKFILFNRTSITTVATDVAHELEFNIESFDLGQYATYPQDLLEKISEHHLTLTAPLYLSTISAKNEKVPLPLQEFDVRLQAKMLFKAAIVFFILWILTLGFGYWQMNRIIADQEKRIAESSISTEQEEISKAYEQARKQNESYDEKHQKLQKYLKLQYQWLCLYYGLLESRETDKILFTQISLQEPIRQEGGFNSNESKSALDMSVSFKIMQAYGDAETTYRKFQEKLKNFFTVVSDEEIKGRSTGKEEGRAFKLVLRLKEEKAQ